MAVSAPRERGPTVAPPSTAAEPAALAGQRATLLRLQQRHRALTPRGAYLIIDTADNRFSLRRGESLLREGVCSTGSYTLLRAEGDRQWLFRTPRGRLQVQGKREHPVWRKPDWAFIEEGLPVPPAGAAERFEAGVLGDYALSLGDGYLIHGTLYKRLLGQPVTHGCVRMDDEDLREVYRALPLGAPVYIY
ncbi:L,D-transpeptidase [bacterium]|nr:L,D-transpeptidase [bacterium]